MFVVVARRYKTCSNCRLEKTITNFRLNRTTTDGYAHECADCLAKIATRRRNRNGIKNTARRTLGIEPTGTKKCSTCKVVKPVAEFTRDKGTNDGLAWRCKPCGRTHQVALKQRHGIVNDALVMTKVNPHAHNL